MYRRRRVISYLLSAALIITSTVFLSPKKAYASTLTGRLGGVDRYETAVKISQAGWETSENIVLATGEDFPDALSAAPLARQLDAPILLTDKDQIDSRVEAEIDRLHAKNVFIVGGDGVVSDKVKNKLEQKKLTVKRLYGVDRYSTSIAVAEYISTIKDGTEIVVATGEDFPDALSIAPVAARMGMPIILTEKGKLPDSAKKYISREGITKSYIIGGNGVISDSVKNVLPGAERISGQDRYETNVAVMNRFAGELKLDEVYMAVGEDFPDALAGSALAPKTSSPIILTYGDISGSTNRFIIDNLQSISSVKVLGGEGVVPESSLRKIVIDNVRGNTPGNIINGGLTAMDGNWTYFINDTLEKIEPDGIEGTKISDDAGVFMNVKDGWIYYTNVTEEGKGSIYKIKEDGTGRTRLNNEPSFFVNVVGDWIYYINFVSDGQGKIYRMKTDGTGSMELGGDLTAFYNVYDGWVYYINMSDGAKIYRMKTDGSLRQSLGVPAVSLNAAGGFIYYVNILDNGKIYRMRTDGTDNRSLNVPALTINVSGDWIYFNNINDENKLYKMKIDGTDLVKLSDDVPALINIAGDYIYYASGSSESESLYRMRTDGTQKQIVK